MKTIRFVAPAICALPLLASVPADASAILNASHYGIVALQVKPAGAIAWQADVLNQHTLGVGKSVNVNVGQCDVDVLATFDDGHKALRQHVNLCNGPLQIRE